MNRIGAVAWLVRVALRDEEGAPMVLTGVPPRVLTAIGTLLSFVACVRRGQ